MKRGHARPLALTACLLAVGCDADTSDEPAATSEALEVDGLLLVHDIDHLLLVDPTTGKHGAELRGAYALTPDLWGVFYYTGPTFVGGDNVMQLVLARFGLAADGTPTLTTEATTSAVVSGAAATAMAPPSLNPQGDRVVGAGWWDPATGEHLLASGAMSPDGRRHLGADGLYDDLDPDAIMPAGGAFTGDGHWLVTDDGLLGEYFWLVHVPSRTQVLRPDADRPDRGFARPIDPVTDLRLPYFGTDPRGRLTFVSGGRRGLLIPEDCGTPPEVVGPIPPIVMFDPVDVADGVAQPIETPLEALNALPKEGDDDGPFDGFEWSVLGLTPDGEAAIVQHQWYRLERAGGNLGCPIYRYVPRTLDVFRVELEGDGELVDQVHARGELSGCVPPSDPYLPFSDRLRRNTVGIHFLNEHDWICSGDEETAAAFIDGVGQAPPTRYAWPTVDQQALLVAADTQAAAIYGDARATNGLCTQEPGGSVTACLVPPDLPWARRVVAQVAIDQVQRKTAGPIVTLASHTSATPGTPVVVRGHGFGSSGVLALGDLTVPAAAIVSWGEQAITFTMPEDAPDVGLVAVTVGAQTSVQRHVWIGRSRPWAAAPAVPLTPYELRQGVNRYTFPGAGGYTVGVRSLDQIFPGGDLPSVPEGVGPDHTDAVLATPLDARVRFRWLTFRSPRGLTFRPLEYRHGVVEAALWQPIAEAVPIHDWNRFVTTAGVLHLEQTAGPRAAIMGGGADEDWRIGTFLGYPAGTSAGFRDGDAAWHVSGAELVRLTGWTDLGADPLQPVYATEITTSFTLPIRSFGVHDDLVVVMLEETINAQAYRSLHVSTDHGAHFTEAIPSSKNLWSTWSTFVEGGRPGLYGAVSQMGEDLVYVERVARVRPDGALEISAATPPTPAPNVQCRGGFVAFGHRLLCHDGVEARLYVLDVAVADGAWTEVGGELAGTITAIATTPSGALLAGTKSGTLWESEDTVAWSQRDQVGYGPVAMPLSIQALGLLPGGELLALVQQPAWSNGQILVRAR